MVSRSRSLDRVARRTTRAEFDAALDRIASFEQTLAADGALILKFWMHLRPRRRTAAAVALEGPADPLARHQDAVEAALAVRPWFIDAAERLIQRTSFGHAPWIIVDGADERYRNLVVATEIRDALYRALGHGRTAAAGEAARRLPAGSPAAPAAPAGLVSRVDRERSVLDVLDMTPDAVERALQDQLLRAAGPAAPAAAQGAKAEGRSVILRVRGLGRRRARAAPSDGLSRRSTRVLSGDPVAAPTDEERAHHYLWRFWRHLSRAGRVTIFDRSWYGRVLVERVEPRHRGGVEPRLRGDRRHSRRS